MKRFIKNLLREEIRKIGDNLFAWHGSPNYFKKFKYDFLEYRNNLEFGFHFGSREQAEQRLNITNNGDGYLYQVFLNIKNPIRMEENRLGNWKPYTILRELIPKIGDDDEILFMETDGEEGMLTTNSGVSINDIGGEVEDIGNWFYGWLLKKGYDSIVYVNTFEGGGDSYIVFDPNKIRIYSVYDIHFTPETKIDDMEISDNLLIKLKGSHNNIEELQDFVIVWAEHLAESLNKEEKIELSNLIKFLISKKVFQEYTEPDNLENLRFLSHLYY
jgi:hypothetical protein